MVAEERLDVLHAGRILLPILLPLLASFSTLLLSFLLWFLLIHKDKDLSPRSYEKKQAHASFRATNLLRSAK